MKESRESEIRGFVPLLALFLLAVVAAPSVFAKASGRSTDLISWIGVGPRVVVEGHVGGIVEPISCNCNTDGDNQPCPQRKNSVGQCTTLYHTCYTNSDLGANKNYCVGSGNANYCGQSNCIQTQWGECTGPCGH